MSTPWVTPLYILWPCHMLYARVWERKYWRYEQAYAHAHARKGLWGGHGIYLGTSDVNVVCNKINGKCIVRRKIQQKNFLRKKANKPIFIPLSACSFANSFSSFYVWSRLEMISYFFMCLFYDMIKYEKLPQKAEKVYLLSIQLSQRKKLLFSFCFYFHIIYFEIHKIT